LQAGWSQDQGQLKWALILAPACLNPALHFFEENKRPKWPQIAHLVSEASRRGRGEHFEPGNKNLNKPLADATYQISNVWT